MHEQVQSQGNNINFPTNIKPGDNIRHAGEDIKTGDLLLKKGKKITAVDLGLLAAAGLYQIPVYRKLRIAFLSTGDELQGIGQTLAAGQLYDSNRYTLSGLLADQTFSVTDLGRCRDDKQTLKQLLQDAASNYDVIITTGGASVGEADYIKEIVDEIGQVNFWKIAMKPGKPLAFGQIQKAWFFGLPGNPVSVIATFQQIVTPALQQLSGENFRSPLRVQATCTSALKKTPGRQEFQRGILTQLGNGKFQVQSAGKQGSHILGSISRANCYIILPADCSGVAIGESVLAEPFDRLI
jgi:molybdopterin molybdotransferase